ncbi:sphingomyelin synthase [Allomyces javanicus]|nr:sphingomyelin synthase [Allomyces javanicus]
MTVAEDAGAARHDGAPLAPLSGRSSHQASPTLPRADSAYGPPTQIPAHLHLESGRRAPRTSSTAMSPHAVLLDIDMLDPAPRAATFNSPFIACLANAYADRINPNNLVPMDERRALLDPGMNWAYAVFRSIHVLPRDLPDWMTRLASALIISRAVTLGRRGCTVFRRALYIAGAAYFLRAPTVLMTVLPNPLLECESRPHPNLVLDAFMLFTQSRSSCGDVFFSGHSIFFILQARLWLQYSRHPVLRMLAVAVAIFSLASLIFSGYHYSIDVFMATLIVSTLYSLYHWTVQGKIGSRSWWGRLIVTLDGEYELDRRAGRRLGRRSTRRSGPRRAARRSAMTGATTPPGMSATSGSNWWSSARTRSTPSPLLDSRPCSGRGPASDAATVAAAWLASKKWDDPTAFAAAEASEGDVDVDEDDVELGYVRPSHRAAVVAVRDSDASDVEGR